MAHNSLEATEYAQYIVFELYRELSRATVIEVRGEEGAFVVQTAQADPAQGPGGYRGVVETLLNQCQLAESAEALLVFDTSQAVVMQQEISLTRADWNSEIAMPEVENSIRHSVWQAFQRDRAAASRFLQIPDLALRLADVDIVQMKLDGHRVLSPLGFRAHTFAYLLRQTFVRAQPWQEISNLIGQEHMLAVVERSGFWAGYAATVLKGDGIFLDIGTRHTSVYSLTAGAIEYRDAIEWGTDNVFFGIARLFGVPMQAAPGFIDRYAQQRVSPAMHKAIGGALQAEFAVLMHAIAACQGSRVVPVYIHSVVPLPDFLGKEKLMRQLGIRES